MLGYIFVGESENKIMKAILIDDERPALRGLEVLLKNYTDVEIAGMFTDPFEGLEKAGILLPDVIFLDINIPQLSGIDIASAILDKAPNANIVFVTAYDQYAIQAFELHALDYLLKPVDVERLAKTIERVRKKSITEKSVGNMQKILTIRCFGRFDIGFESYSPIKWRAEKTKELFAYLLHNSKKENYKDEILDALWRKDHPEKAVKQLYNGIYYIRKALEEYGVERRTLSIDSKYHIEFCAVDYDVERFCVLYRQQQNRMEALSEMEAIYIGDYLAALPYDWALFERQRYLDMYLHCVTELCGLYMQNNRYSEAAALLQKAYRKDPFSESVTELLIKVYLITDNKTAAMRHFVAYSQLLDYELHISPPERIKKLLRDR